MHVLLWALPGEVLAFAFYISMYAACRQCVGLPAVLPRVALPHALPAFALPVVLGLLAPQLLDNRKPHRCHDASACWVGAVQVVDSWLWSNPRDGFKRCRFLLQRLPGQDPIPDHEVGPC